MVSFIICDENGSMRKCLCNKIKRFLFTKEEHYKILEIEKIEEKDEKRFLCLDGTKVFILNIDSPPNLEYAKKIRESGDFISPIILYSKDDAVNYIEKLRNILFLDVIKLDGRFEEHFIESMSEAYKIITRHSVYTFSIFDEIYRIPYNDIYCIVKNFKDDSVTIYTKDDSYINYATVKGIEERLESDARFLKTHRSCIINLYNVLSYDSKNNIIIFKNGMTIDLISKQNKPLLIERLKNFNNIS